MENSKNNVLKKWWFWGIIILIIICISFVGNDTQNESNNEVKEENIINESKQNESKTIENIEMIYKDDEAINLFINKFNKNNENKITSDMITKKHIGGSDRDDVVSILNDKLEINIYDNYGSKGKYNMSVYVGYTKVKATLDDYKEQFYKFIKLFDDTLTNEEIENHWNTLISEYHSSYKINDIDLGVNTNEGSITYFKFTKTIEL
jgi:hypothetical protein